MALDLIRYAFAAGEVAPSLYWRGDMEQFDFGLKLAKNFFVDFKGGLSTRPGTEFLEFVMDDDQPTKFFDFRFAPDEANTFGILFGSDYVRFFQRDGYILEAAKTITGVTQANPAVVTSAAHGFANGDWIKIAGVAGMTQLNGKTFQVANVATNTFELQSVPAIVNVNSTAYGAYTSGGTASRIYTISSPYDPDDLEELKAFQLRDNIRLTHRSYPIKNLIRNSNTDWEIENETIGNDKEIPDNLAWETSRPATGDDLKYGAAYTVTAVYQDGIESRASEYLLVDESDDWSQVSANITVTWDAIDDVAFYNVYRSIIVEEADIKLTRAQQVGYLGQAFGPIFIDNNIIPDFTATPPLFSNPFANSKITAINITAGGTLYTASDTVVVTGAPGAGFIGYPVVGEGGVILAVVVVDGGANYVTPVVSFTSGTGSGATATATVSEATGNYPAVSGVFQQRQIYASTTNEPLAVFAGKPGKFSNFDVSQIVADNDSYEFELDAAEIAPIRHMVATRGGLLLLSELGIWQLSGGQEGVVTPKNALAEPQSFAGCSNLPPITVGTDILYSEEIGTVRLLSYNDNSKVYGGLDVSILSNHFFTSAKYLTSWGFAYAPYSLVWGVRSDGALLSFTLVKEQKVYAWCQHWTKGLFLDTLTIRTPRDSDTYFMVKRYLSGRWTKCLEAFASRQVAHVEDAWAVDCGLATSHVYPAAGLQLSASSGTVTATATAGVFASGDVGKVLRACGAKGVVTAFTDSTHITVALTRDATELLAEDDDETPLPCEQGEWSLDATFTSVSGLDHLNGQTVSAFADGNVYSDLTVTNGAVTLPEPASYAVVGLPFVCRAQTLPFVVPGQAVEARRKKVVGAATSLLNSSGLRIGSDFVKMYPLRQRPADYWGEPLVALDGVQFAEVDGKWESEATVCWEVRDPLPVTILGVLTSVDFGDDQN